MAECDCSDWNGSCHKCLVRNVSSGHESEAIFQRTAGRFSASFLLAFTRSPVPASKLEAEYPLLPASESQLSACIPKQP